MRGICLLALSGSSGAALWEVVGGSADGPEANQTDLLGSLFRSVGSLFRPVGSLWNDTLVVSMLP